MTSLPFGWISTTIDQINFYSGRTIDPRKTPAQQFELYSVPSFPTRKPEILNGREIGSIKQSIEPDDVLLCKINPRINRVWKTGPRGSFPQVGSSEWIVIRQPLLNADFLRYQLSENSFREKICSEVSGIGGSLTRAKPNKVSNYTILIPPVAEQNRIAQKIDELLDQAETLKTRIEEVLALLKTTRKSILSAAVSGRLTADWRRINPEPSVNLEILKNVPRTRRGVPENVKLPDFFGSLAKPDNWIWASAAQLLKKGLLIDLKDGNHGSNHPKTSEFTHEGLPFITAASVSNSGAIDYLNAPKIAGEPLERIRVGFSEPGDVIFTHKGTVGRVAINTQNCVLTPQTTYYRTNQEILSNRYLSIFLKSNRFQIQTNEIKSQTTRDFIPIAAQYELFHLIPPPLEQIEIVHRTEQLLSYIDQLESKVITVQTLINHLPQSILAKAFRGELTDDWRVENKNLISGENSAAALMKKIQTVRKEESEQSKNKSIDRQKKAGKAMSKEITKVLDALRESDKPLSGQQLLAAAGYPQDSDTELLEQFFLDIRSALSQKQITRLPRDEDGQDWFALAKPQ